MEKRISTRFASDDKRFRGFKLDEIHSTFIRNVSHELRTPLAVLMGYADLLNTGELGALAPEQQEAMFIIINRAQELRTMVARISTILAIQTDEYLKHPLALSALVAQMLEAQRVKAAEAGITLDLNLFPDLPQIIGNPQQLQQAIECLIENGIKFTPHGGRIELHISGSPGWVNLTVTDTGIGIETEELEQLFTPFQQSDNTPMRYFGGLGLGLTLVYNVVEAHGGKIEVESAPGQGSRFTLRFPALSPIEDQSRDTQENATLQRILIVDDEEFVAFTLQEGLEKLPNCEVVVAMTGQEALELFEQQPFDLLITDYKMPDMNGVTLAQRIRNLYPRTGIIMITAYSHDLIHEPSAASSIQHFLNKPIRLSEIRSVALETLNENLQAEMA